MNRSRRATALRFLPLFLLVLSLFFVALSNLFVTLNSFWDLPEHLRQWRVVLATLPDFTRDLPQELERQSFVVFDQAESQLELNSPIFAKETLVEGKEAGQSAVQVN